MNEKERLQGKRVLVTRSKRQAASFSDKIKAMGGISIEVPLLSFQPSNDTKFIQKTMNELNYYDWIVFTSTNGVDFFFQFLNDMCKADTILPKIAVVGQKTKKKVEEKGYKVDLIPDTFTAKSLVDSLIKENEPSKNILLARGNLAEKEIVTRLEGSSFFVKDLIVYNTIFKDVIPTHLKTLLLKDEVDFITFTSPSTIKQFVALIHRVDWKERTKKIPVVCIGPSTKKEAEANGFQTIIMPNTYTIDGMVERMVEFVQK